MTLNFREEDPAGFTGATGSLEAPGIGIKTDPLRETLENEKTRELYDSLLKKFKEKFEQIPDTMSKRDMVDISLLREMKKPINPLESHIIIKHDKMIIQWITEYGRDTSIVIDKNSREPQRILHLVDYAKDKNTSKNTFDINNKQHEFDENLFNLIIDEYLNSECNIRVTQGNNVIYSSRPDDLDDVRDYNGLNTFNDTLRNLCSDLDIDQNDLSSYKISVTIEDDPKYKIKINDNEISVRCPGDNDNILCFSITKDSVKLEEISKIAFPLGSTIQKISKHLRTPYSTNKINFDEEKFEEAIKHFTKNKKNLKVKKTKKTW